MPRIVVRDTQSGFVGATGTVLTIEPDGSYVRAALLPHKTGETLSRGVLDQAARDAIARALEDNGFASLPERLGGRPAAANPHEITMTVAAKTVTLVMASGLPSPSSKPGADDDPDIRRFLAILLVIREQTKM
jgi:hypothetical protein